MEERLTLQQSLRYGLFAPMSKVVVIKKNSLLPVGEVLRQLPSPCGREVGGEGSFSTA
jgi:hypothetical protein